MNMSKELRKSISLRIPLTVQIHKLDSHWFCENTELGLASCGTSQDEAVRHICEDFIMTWDGLRNEGDDDLTLDARELRDRLREMIGGSDIAG